MKRSVVMAVIGLLFASAVSPAFAEEGFTREAGVSPSAYRTSRYSGTHSGAHSVPSKPGIVFKAGKPTEKTKRAATVQRAPSFSDFYI